MTRYKKMVTFSTKIPRCWPIESLADYKLWREASYVASPNPKSSICEDCTPEYQARMLELKKCENPEIIFDVDEDGFIYGKLPRHKDLAKKRHEQQNQNKKPSHEKGVDVMVLGNDGEGGGNGTV